MATSGSVRARERAEWILRRLERDGAIDLKTSAQELGVSTMTLRRDVDELESQGLLRRVRGGAVAGTGPRLFSERRTVRLRAKRTIASKAASLLPSAGAIALDASTTVGMLVEEIAAAGTSLVVATNSHETFTALSPLPDVRAVLVGGEAEPATESLVGPVACRGARSLRYQRLFVSAGAVDETNGTSEVSLEESEVKRAFASVSHEVVLCVDSSKLGQQALAHAFGLAEVSVMVTDLDPADERLDAYRTVVDLI